MHLEKILVDLPDLKLMLNYAGVVNGKIDEVNFTLSIYAINPSTSKPIFSSTLNLMQTRELFLHLDSLEIVKNHGLVSTSTIVEVKDDMLKDLLGKISIIGDGILKSFLSKFSRERKIKEIIESLSDIELNNLIATVRQQNYKSELKKLSIILILEEKGSLLKMINRIAFISEYSAGQPEKILQNWLEKNLWVFGVEYEKIENFRQISESSEGDLIMKSIDGYLDLIELKKSKYELLRFDTSHNCYYGSSHLNKVLGQSMHYLKSLQTYASTLGSQHDVMILRPRIKIVAGRSYLFTPQEFDTLRMINSHLVDISVMTYDEILKYGKKIISHYE